MKKKAFSMIGTLVIILGLTTASYAQMQSDNYSIPTSVLSGGGEPMTSTSYQTDATLGQPSPLMESSSANYGLSPGFWYTVVVEVVDACEGNFDGDSDVDGSDLATFAADFGRTDCAGDCEGDFDGDNDVDGSDLATFAADFGRTDCP